MVSREGLRRQLVFLAERRSMAEMEQILGRMLEDGLSHWEEEHLQRLILLLQRHTDLDLLDWLSGLQEPGEGVDREVLGWVAASVARHRQGGTPGHDV